MLSGGNIQKVIAARELSGNSDCIIADQPTRGIDIGAAMFIHQKLLQMRDMGMAILLISADLSEIMAISDSLIVMYGGRIVAYFHDASKVSEQELGQYMLGVRKMDDETIVGCEQ
jgi:simple sugar transport system ATP-binding protein